MIKIRNRRFTFLVILVLLTNMACNIGIASADAITYESTGQLAHPSISIASGTTEADAIAELDSTIDVLGSSDETGSATIAWTIDGYDATTAGEYTATGILTLPPGWTGSPDDVIATITVEPAEPVIITYALTGQLAHPTISIASGTTEGDAIAQLDSTVEIEGSSDENGSATIDWTVDGYDATTAGDYTATGILTLPSGWIGSPDDVIATITVQPTESVIITYALTGQLAHPTISIACGTTEADAIAELDSTVEVLGSSDENGVATITWTIDSYYGTIAGDYTATGVLTLPSGWTGTPDNVNTIVKVQSNSVYGNQDGDFYFVLVDGEAQITKYAGPGGAVIIPSALGGFPVTNIGYKAFYNSSNITSVNIPQGVTFISGYAFYGCYGLTSINIPQGNTFIAGYCFTNCSNLTSINIPDGVTKIGDYAFANCSLRTINIPDGVTSIGDYAFVNNQELTTVTMPPGVTHIGIYCFQGCYSLTSIPQNMTHFNLGVFSHCTSLTSAEIPSGVTSIGGEAFNYCTALTSVSLPEGLTDIPPGAFSQCYSLTTINIPKSVTKIYSAFGGCISLSTIDISEGVSNIDYYAFTGCSNLQNIMVDVNNSKYASVNGALFNKDINTLIIYPEGLTTFSIPQTVTSIGVDALGDNKKLTSIDIPQEITTIDLGAFGDCSNLISITFNSATTQIYDQFNTIPIKTTITGYDPSTAKDYATKYGRTFQAIEPADTPVSIAITTPATKLSYSVGETLNISGLVVTGTYSDGSTKIETITTANVTGFNSSAANPAETLTIMYGGKTTSYNIEILPGNNNGYSDDMVAFALCQLTYTNIPKNWEGKTVQQFVDEKRYKEYKSNGDDKIWNNSDITYGKYYSDVAGDWKIEDVPEDGTNAGFYGVVFRNDHLDKTIICYRGTEPPDLADDMADIKFVFNVLDPCFDQALNLYENHKNEEPILSGHSLGGAMASYVSMMTGAPAITLNAPTGDIIDVVYENEGKLNTLQKYFDGVDAWNFRNSITYTTNAGNIAIAYRYCERYQTDFYKRNSLGVVGDSLDHSIQSIIKYDTTSDMFKYTDYVVSGFEPSVRHWGITHNLTNALALGTSGDDNIEDINLNGIETSSYLYGGDGDDSLLSARLSRLSTGRFIGGEGDDNMATGALLPDIYYYTKGDGEDYISDTGGNDKIVLRGFGQSDSITVDYESDNDYVLIKANNKTIIDLSKNRNGYFTNSFEIDINGKTTKIQDWNAWKNTRTVIAHCPVAMEFYDQNGNLIVTLGNYDMNPVLNDIGQFWVAQDPDTGDFTKVATLYDDSYSVKLTGTGTGTMDYAVQETDDKGNVINLTAKNVPITPTTIITNNLESSADRALFVQGDAGASSYTIALMTNTIVPSGGGSGGGSAVSLTPTLQTTAATMVTSNSAVMNGSITSDSGYDITDYGFRWGITADSLTNKLDVGTDAHSGAFTGTLSNLLAGTTYYFQAYATNSSGTEYGAVMNFTTTTGSYQTTKEPIFSDVSAYDWYNNAVRSLCSKGIVSGYQDGTFKPDASITRAEFATMLVKALGLNTSGSTSKFTDVAQNTWCFDMVNTAASANLVSGIGNNLFAPNQLITREQMAVMVTKGLGIKAPISDGSELKAFSDSSIISNWAMTGMGVAVKAGIVSGMNAKTIAPLDNASRAQAAQMIYNMLTFLGK